MQYTLYPSFKEVPIREWESQLSEKDFFLSPTCLQIIEDEHKEEIEPLYILIKDQHKVIGIVYAQIFKLNGVKVRDYINNGNNTYSIVNLLKSYLSNFLNLKIAFLGNTFLTNEASFRIAEEYSHLNILEDILKTINNYSQTKFILIPEFYEFTTIKHLSNLVEIKVEPDMHLKIDPNWSTFDDYINAIRSKYKKRYRKVLKKSSNITKKKLNLEQLRNEADTMKQLFYNVFQKSKFNAAKFNTDVFYDLMLEKKNVTVYGYYLQNKLVGFASDICSGDTLYAHFVGLDYEMNNRYEIYNRMLYEQINFAINNNLSLIKFGRTAAEFKSTIGAIPLKGQAYVFHPSNTVLYILKPILKMLKPKKWTQRNPFK